MDEPGLTPQELAEAKAAKSKAYREKNREKIAAYMKAYRRENREKIAAGRRAYYLKNKEKEKEYRKAYSEANREAERERRQKHYAENREQILERQRERRAEANADRRRTARRNRAAYPQESTEDGGENMAKIEMKLTMEELSTLNEALRFANPFPAGRRKRVFDKVRSDIRMELALAVEEEEANGR